MISHYETSSKKRRSEHFHTIFAKSAGFDYCNRRKIPTWRRCNKRVEFAGKDNKFDVNVVRAWSVKKKSILLSQCDVLAQFQVMFHAKVVLTYSTCFCASPAKAPPRSFGRLAFFTILSPIVWSSFTKVPFLFLCPLVNHISFSFPLSIIVCDDSSEVKARWTMRLVLC